MSKMVMVMVSLTQNKKSGSFSWSSQKQICVLMKKHFPETQICLTLSLHFTRQLVGVVKGVEATNKLCIAMCSWRERGF